jgi:uncharacterized SAM-binding protein YcdF (DUF218 family)
MRLNWRRVRRYVGIAIAIALISWWGAIAIQLRNAASQPVDAYFVLGGSIRREIHVAQLLTRSPQIPVLISHGSPEPCIWIIFERENAPRDRVWLENCANNTFENFFFGVPILRQWQARHVKLITSQTHLPRAAWLAKIHLGARGIWVETEVAPEQGIPGNREHWLKTSLDITRSLAWTLISPLFQPHCPHKQVLAEVDMATWQAKGFKCEHQANINPEDYEENQVSP